MQIRSLEIDFSQKLLKINGETFSERPVIVTLPGDDGWNPQMLINSELLAGEKEEYDRLDVIYTTSEKAL